MIARPDRDRLDTEHAGDLFVGALLDATQDDDLAVVLRKPRKDAGDLAHGFATDRPRDDARHLGLDLVFAVAGRVGRGRVE